jgi:hypothetical protein
VLPNHLLQHRGIVCGLNCSGTAVDPPRAALLPLISSWLIATAQELGIAALHVETAQYIEKIVSVTGIAPTCPVLDVRLAEGVIADGRIRWATVCTYMQSTFVKYVIRNITVSTGVHYQGAARGIGQVKYVVTNVISIVDSLATQTHLLCACFWAVRKQIPLNNHRCSLCIATM